jgi:hypothetical protein
MMFRNVVFVVALGILSFGTQAPLAADCSTTAGSCSSLSDCTNEFPWPCDEACVDLCGTFVKHMECIDGSCWCLCDTRDRP